MQKYIFEKIEKEIRMLTPDEQLKLIENLFHLLARKLTVEKELNWDALYGLGKGL